MNVDEHTLTFAIEITSDFLEASRALAKGAHTPEFEEIKTVFLLFFKRNEHMLTENEKVIVAHLFMYLSQTDVLFRLGHIIASLRELQAALLPDQ